MFGRERVDFPLEVVPLSDKLRADGFEMLDVLGGREFGGGLLALLETALAVWTLYD
jgi:hypothetical protein